MKIGPREGSPKVCPCTQQRAETGTHWVQWHAARRWERADRATLPPRRLPVLPYFQGSRARVLRARRAPPKPALSLELQGLSALCLGAGCPGGEQPARAFQPVSATRPPTWKKDMFLLPSPGGAGVVAMGHGEDPAEGTPSGAWSRWKRYAWAGQTPRGACWGTGR